MVALHMIGNAHIDPVWLWRWPDGCAEAIATAWSAVDRLDENEGFVFTRGEALIYRWIEDLDAALFERIRRFVAAGRWVIVNGWWLQPDCNIPSGEALIRQALYGKRYFHDRFGIDVTIGYNVDSFGHAATLPMLLRHTGFSSYVFMRPGPHEMKLPGELFDWVSPDGSSVRTFRIQTAYNTSERNLPLAAKIDEQLELSRAAGHPFMCFYGVGNHGGGPTLANIAEIDRRVAAGQSIAFSDPASYFAAVADRVAPRVTTELQFHAIGCYSAGSSLKALNRRAEAALDQAETAAALATLRAGADYDHASFAGIWQRLLFNQFHDTLGGTTIESAYVDAERQFGAVIADAEEMLNRSVRRLAATVRPADDPTAANFLVMNFNDGALDGLVEAEPWTDFDGSPRVLLDESGREVPFQSIAPEASTRGMHRIAFRAAVPAFGYRLYSFAKRVAGIPATTFAATTRSEMAFETAGWRLEIDGDTGAIARLQNRATASSLFAGTAHQAIVVDDPSDTWSHDQDRFGLAGERLRLESVSVVERGPIRTAVQVAAGNGRSRMITTIVLPEAADLPIELRVVLDWREHHRLLRLAYPFGAAGFEYEVPAGWVERPDDGREVLGHRWVRVQRPDIAVVLTNDAKYSYAAADGTLFVTAVRAPVYAHHDPLKLDPAAPHRFMDQGEQRFTIRIQGAPKLSRRDAVRLADQLLKPPVVTPHVARGGQAPTRDAWLALDSGSATISALKGSETGRAIVVRAVELEGDPTRLVLGATAIAIPPRGIVTGRLDGGRLTGSDGLER